MIEQSVHSYVYNCGYPVTVLDRKTNLALTDPTTLTQYHQKIASILLADYLHDVLLDRVSITQGKMMFLHFPDARPLTSRVQISYHIEREPSEKELEKLRITTVTLLQSHVGGRAFKELNIRISPPNGPDFTGTATIADDEVDRLEFANELFDAIDTDRLNDLEATSDKRKKLEARKFGLTPLLWALSKAKTAAASRLIDMGSDAKAISRVDGAGTVLLCAVHPAISDELALAFTKALIGKGADMNLKIGSGKTALMLAKTKNKPKLVAWLTEQGAV